MSETKTKQNPIFRVTMAPGFATGLVMHPPGSEIEWVVPEDWDEKKNGKHYASFGPSVTFECVNAEAKALMAEHHENIRKKHAPKPVASSANEELVLKLLAQNGEILAELRRAREEAEEKGKKK